MNLQEKIRLAVTNAVDSGAHLNAAEATEMIAKALGLDEKMVQFTHVELRNKAYESSFKKIPYNERILFLPHCSRAKNCKAIQHDEGYECAHCRCCDIHFAEKMAKELGYKKVFIVPGGSMVKKLLEKYQPQGAIGVSCFNEAKLAFEMLKDGKIIPQIVLLLRDGCKETIIDLPLLEEKLRLKE